MQSPITITQKDRLGAGPLSRADRFAFYGNCLLQPLKRDHAFVLRHEFWSTLVGTVLDTEVQRALKQVQEVVKQLSDLPVEQALERLAVSYTALFVGPGKPLAPPWETLYRPGGTVLFGEATFQMKALFRRYGMSVDNANNQLEDHIGLQLLLLSTLYRMLESEDDIARDPDEIDAYITEHLCSWIDSFLETVTMHDHSRFYHALVVLIAAELKSCS